MTIKHYITSDSLDCTSTLVSSGFSDQPWIIADKTIFHPQGGGQKSDQGTINGIEVTHVRHHEDGIVHYLKSDISENKGAPLKMMVNKEVRIHNSSLHTAGHLIGVLVEELYPSVRACKAHHWSGEARVEFQGDILPDIEEVLDALQTQLDVVHKINTPIQRSYDPKTGRSDMTISGYTSIPCGGTHLSNTGDLEKVLITNIKVKKGILRISYDL